MRSYRCSHCKQIRSHGHPKTICTDGLSTRGAGLKISRGALRMGGRDWWKTGTCDACPPMDRIEDDEIELLSSLLQCESCVLYLYQQWKCQCKKVRTLCKHLRLQDQWHALLNVRSAAHEREGDVEEKSFGLKHSLISVCSITSFYTCLHTWKMQFGFHFFSVWICRQWYEWVMVCSSSMLMCWFLLAIILRIFLGTTSTGTIC